MKRREFITAARRRGGCMAARGACAAIGDAGDRVSWYRVARSVSRISSPRSGKG